MRHMFFLQKYYGSNKHQYPNQRDHKMVNKKNKETLDHKTNIETDSDKTYSAKAILKKQRQVYMLMIQGI